MSDSKMSTEQLHNDFQELKQEVRQQGSVQRDMRDAILILTENQKKIDAYHEKLERNDQITQAQEVRISLVEAKVLTHEEKMKNLPETNVAVKWGIAIAGVIGTGVIAFMFKVLSDIASKVS